MNGKKDLGKLIQFDTIRPIKGLVRLGDGNYMEITVVVHKVWRNDSKLTPDGFPMYSVNSTNVMSLWKPGEIAQLEESKGGEKP